MCAENFEEEEEKKKTRRGIRKREREREREERLQRRRCAPRGVASNESFERTYRDDEETMNGIHADEHATRRTGKIVFAPTT